MRNIALCVTQVVLGLLLIARPATVNAIAQEVALPAFEAIEFADGKAYCYGHLESGIRLSLEDTTVSLNGIMAYPPLVQELEPDKTEIDACAQLCLDASALRLQAMKAGASQDTGKKRMLGALTSSALVDSVLRIPQQGKFEIWEVYFNGKESPDNILVRDNPLKRKTSAEKLAHRRALARSIFENTKKHLEDGDIVFIASAGGPYFLPVEQLDVVDQVFEMSQEDTEPGKWNFLLPIPRQVAIQLLNPLPLSRRQH